MGDERILRQDILKTWETNAKKERSKVKSRHMNSPLQINICSAFIQRKGYEVCEGNIKYHQEGD